MNPIVKKPDNSRSHTATERRRHSDTSPLVTANSDIHQSSSNQSSASRSTTPRRIPSSERILHRPLRTRERGGRVAKILASRSAQDIGAGIQNPRHHSGVRGRRPRWNDIAPQQLGHTGNSNAILQTECLPSQGPAVRIALDQELMRPCLAEDLLFGGRTPDILTGIPVQIRHGLIVREI